MYSGYTVFFSFCRLISLHDSLPFLLREVLPVGADVADRHRLAGLAVELQLWVEFAEILQLRQRRQFIQALEAEVVEEALGGAEQLRAAGDVAVADDADPLALFQRLDDVAVQDRKSTRLNSSHY